MNEQPKLYAYGQYVTDKASFGFDEHGARIGETPNVAMDAGSAELANILAAAPAMREALERLERPAPGNLPLPAWARAIIRNALAAANPDASQ